MNYFIYTSYIALLFCLSICFFHFFKLISLGAPKDLSKKSGSISAGVLYSNTVAMSPVQKESAYKHIPTYIAGIMLHIGSFVAILCFVILFFDLYTEDAVSTFFFQQRLISTFISCILWMSSCCGIVLIIKRVVSTKLRSISNADDFISTGLVTLFLLISAKLFTVYGFHNLFHQFFSHQLHELIFCAYFIFATLLFIYIPIGKLKHVVYYFAARYHLGFFYGRRGTWPPKSINN